TAACKAWRSFDGEVVEDEAVRGFWVPYMEVETMISSGNIAKSKTAIEACLDDCVSKGANTVYFHVRANSDAYYKSTVYDANPKAKSLLASGFDPFAYAVELAHQKGLKIEAWVNPYRIGTDSSRAKTDAIFQYSGRYYYVPSDADVQALVVAGVRELVNNYDIDGVQFDDYFYPTGSVSNSSVESFETADYNAYKNSGGKLGVADWRRSVVNNLVSACYTVCHTRTDCVFGISPSCDFEANYDNMYADAATWAKTPGYVDYLAPQLYVGFKNSGTPFEKCLAAWDALERHDGVKMVAGLALYKTGLLDDTWAGTAGRTEWATNNDIMARQIACAKALDWDGIAFYSHQSFTVASDRDATVANADMKSACVAWLVFQ
ncbi:MAG: family 10 glycosylhydrolase, partial [Clostridia bacterium]|nr:family 10 glycosylhydrolase [Clostridia bacterium]